MHSMVMVYVLNKYKNVDLFFSEDTFIKILTFSTDKQNQATYRLSVLQIRFFLVYLLLLICRINFRFQHS